MWSFKAAAIMVTGDQPPLTFELGQLPFPIGALGIASLLYHIGQHVHAVHQNALRMIMMDRERSGVKPDHVTEKGDRNG